MGCGSHMASAAGCWHTVSLFQCITVPVHYRGQRFPPFGGRRGCPHLSQLMFDIPLLSHPLTIPLSPHALCWEGAARRWSAVRTGSPGSPCCEASPRVWYVYSVRRHSRSGGLPVLSWTGQCLSTGNPLVTRICQSVFSCGGCPIQAAPLHASARTQRRLPRWSAKALPLRPYSSVHLGALASMEGV